MLSVNLNMNNFGDEEFGSDSEDNDYCPTDGNVLTNMK